MIGYVTLGTNDVERATAFYDALFAEMGVGRLMEAEEGVMYGKAMDQQLLAIMHPNDGNPATVGNGVMVALQVESPEAVARLHAKALELGAADEGAPGLREAGGMPFYAGYFRDPDGNKLNFIVYGADLRLSDGDG